MPFWKKSDARPSKGDIETMQDTKLSLAENLPEHVKILDLSQIYLAELPYSILSVVKHQNKDCLILKNNELKDLKGKMSLLEDLRKLDLSFNLFKNVPKNLSACYSLIHLNLDHNDISSLPSFIGSLHNLETLSACSNKIKKIAPEIGSLSKLQSLILKNNEIAILPDSFVYCYKLVNLEVDLEKITYPPAEVVMQGGRATVLWLCEKNSVDSTQVEGDGVITSFQKLSQREEEAERMMLKRHENEAEEADEILAKLKEEEDKMRRISENTNALEENRKRDLQRKLAEENAIEHDKLSEHLRFQNDVKVENIRKALEEVEDKDMDAARILAKVERMRMEEKEYLTKSMADDEAVLKEYMENNVLDYTFISSEMEKVLKEDQMMNSFTKNAEQELHVIFDLVQEEGKQESALYNQMTRNVEDDKAQILRLILDDETLQRKMFITAQQEQDQIYKLLSTQIEGVQEKLLLLTLLEKTEKEMEERMMQDLVAQRTEMANLLNSLTLAQLQRTQELEEATKLMEEQHEDELAHFWLYQYQMLMASTPAKVLREEEEAMKAASKAAHIEKPLQEDEYIGPAVLPDAWKVDPSVPTPENPTAPLATLTASLDNSTVQGECCVCLDNPPSVVFLPCGHVCCCVECGVLSVCPMCRTPISKTLTLFFT